MNNIVLYLQLIIFAMNVLAFIYLLMHADKYNYKVARVVLLIALTIGMVANIGQVTFITILFTFSTFLSLIKINPNGYIYRSIEKLRSYIWGDKQHLQRLQRDSKTVSRQEA